MAAGVAAALAAAQEEKESAVAAALAALRSLDVMPGTPAATTWAGTPQSFHRVEIKDQGEIGHHSIDRDALQGLHEAGIEATRHALVDAGGIEEAIA